MSATEEFDALVRQKMATGFARRKAVSAAAKADKQLHERYLLETNPPSVAGKIRDRLRLEQEARENRGRR